MQTVIENLAKINNVYALLAFCVTAFFILSLIIGGIMIFLKKIGKLTFRKGDLEVDIEPKEKKDSQEHKEESESREPDISDLAFTEKKQDCVTQSLADHSFFADLLRWEKRDIPALKIRSLVKKTIVVEFLKRMFRNFREKFREYVINTETSIGQDQQIKCDELIQFVLDYIDQYNAEAKKIEIKYKNRIICGLPDIFLQKFDEWHNPHIEIINESITRIVNNEIYPDEKMKLLAIIEVFYIAFSLTIQDAIATISELNGEIEKELEKIING